MGFFTDPAWRTRLITAAVLLGAMAVLRAPPEVYKALSERFGERGLAVLGGTFVVMLIVSLAAAQMQPDRGTRLAYTIWIPLIGLQVLVAWLIFSGNARPIGVPLALGLAAVFVGYAFFWRFVAFRSWSLSPNSFARLAIPLAAVAGLIAIVIWLSLFVFRPGG